MTTKVVGDEVELQGLSLSSGVGIGNAFVFSFVEGAIPQFEIASSECTQRNRTLPKGSRLR